MAYEITLPRLGWDMVEGTLGSWLKKEKEFVKAGEPLFSMEGDKAIQDIEAFDSGYLFFLPDGPQPGSKLPVGTLLGYLVPEAELESFQLPGEGQPAAVAQAAGANPAAESQLVVKEAGLPTLAKDGRFHRVYISPYAKKLAEGLGIDWRKIEGSGLRGRIMAKDVEAIAARQKPVPSPATALVPAPSIPAAQPALSASRLPMTPIRRKIAEHMAYSAHTSAPVTLTAEVDATELVTLRKILKGDAEGSGQPVPSYNDILAKLCAQALAEHPAVNARLEGDEIVQLAAVNIAIAVDTERGLIVPVLRNVQAKSLRQLARESAALIEKTRSGAVGYEDLQGATFTITNLGMFEIDAFTPIIDLPQCAILGAGQIVPKPVVIDVDTEKVAVRQRMILSLTFDHRLIDGAQAARFLQRVKKLVETPYLWMAG